jgi:hypothetical protein
MRKIGLLIILCLIVGAGVFGYTKVRENGLRGEGQKELQAQESEKQECQKRLTMFHKALTDFQKDHKGGMPPNLEALIPKYIAKGELLMCPTALRWKDKGAGMRQGMIEMDERTYPVTYGFRCLSSSYPHGLKKYGDAVPMVVCEAHKEGMYRSVYHRPPSADAFDDEKRGSLVSEVRDTKMLAVRKNGKVEELAPDQEL